MEKSHPLETLLLENSTIWAIRLAKIEEMSLERTYLGFEKFYSKFIVAEEGTGIGVHQHIVLSTKSEVQRTEIVDIIKDIYPDAKGNKCLYVQEAKKKKQLLKYTIKEGCFRYCGFTKDYVDQLLLLSQPKTSMKQDLKDLEESLLLSQITFSQFVDGFLRWKIKYNQPIYMTHIEAYLRKMYLKVTDQGYQPYVVYFIEKISMH